MVPPDQVTDTFQTTKDAFDALVTYFSRMETTGQSDKNSAVKIGQALGADSLLVVKVNAWEYTREEGDNIARVGLSTHQDDLSVNQEACSETPRPPESTRFRQARTRAVDS